MNSNEKISLIKIKNLHLNEKMLGSNTIEKTDFNGQNGTDLVFYLDSASMSSTINLNPSFSELIGNINVNIDLDSSVKQLNIEEKRIRNAMLEEEKVYKAELNKCDLMRKSLEIKNKTAILGYTENLRDLFLNAINSGDYKKASFLNRCLINQTDLVSSYYCQNNY